MFEAYKVAVRLSLINDVSPILTVLTRDLSKTNVEVGAVNASLKAMHQRLDDIKRLGLAGGVLAGIGAAGLAAFKGPIEAAREYELTLTRFKTLNLGDAVNRQADQFARGANLMGVSAKDLMQTMSESVGLFGSFDMAKKLAPVLAQLNAANSAIFKGKVGELDEGSTRGLMKFIDRRGGTHDAASFMRNLDLAEKLVTGSGGFVQFRDLDQFSQQGGTAFRGLSDAGVLNMALLLQEQGGARAGTSFMSLYQNLIGGRTPKKTMALLQEYGLGHIEMQEHATVGGKSLKSMVMTDIASRDLLQTNPPEWMRTVFLPALAAHGVTKEGDILRVTNDLLSNRTASNQASIMTTQLLQILRDANLAKNAMGYDQVVKAYSDDPNSKFANLQARWADAMRELGTIVLPVAIKGVQGLTTICEKIIKFSEDWPVVTKGLVGMFGVLSAAALAGGTIALARAGFQGLDLILGAQGIAASAKAAGTSLLGMAATIGKLGALGVAGAAGWEVGSWLHEHLIAGTKADDYIGEIMARVAAALGNKDAQNALDVNHGQTSQAGWGRGSINPVATPAHRHPVAINNTIVMPDGKVLAKVVTREQGREMSRPQTGTSSFDPRMSPMPAGGTGSW